MFTDARLSAHRGRVPSTGQTMWHLPPGRLVSLWDMLRFNARAFVRLMDVLTRCQTLFDEMKGTADELASVSDPGKPEVVRKFEASLKKAVGHSLDLLASAEGLCKQLQLGMAEAQVKRVRRLLASREAVDGAAAAIRELRDRIEDELNGRVFLYVPLDQAPYHDTTTPPFGEEVQDKFPGVGFEITEASLCLGCGRWTAAVFHLMRVMEAGLRRFADLTSTKVGVNPNWGTILKAVNSSVAALPATTPDEGRRRDGFAEVAVYLTNVKNAWRNPVMHIDRIYGREEAEAIFDSVRIFMTALAKMR